MPTLVRPGGLGEQAGEFLRPVGRGREVRQGRDRRKVGREEARQAADVAVQVRLRQRIVARDDAVGDAHAGDQREQLGPAFDDELAAERLDAGEVARDPQHVAKTLLGDEHEAFSRKRLAVPFAARRRALRQLAGDLAHLVVGPTSGVVGEIEIGERAVPARHVVAGLELERARERDHRLAVLARLGERDAEIMVQQRVLAAGERDGAPVAGDGRLQVVELGERIAEIGPHADRAGVAGERIAIAPHGVEVALHRREHHAAPVAQRHVVRVARDRIAQQRLGLGVLAGVVQLRGLGEGGLRPLHRRIRRLSGRRRRHAPRGYAFNRTNAAHAAPPRRLTARKTPVRAARRQHVTSTTSRIQCQAAATAPCRVGSAGICVAVAGLKPGLLAE